MNPFLSRIVLLYHEVLPIARHPIRHTRAAARQYVHDTRVNLIVFTAKPWPDKGKLLGLSCLKVRMHLEFFHSLLNIFM